MGGLYGRAVSATARRIVLAVDPGRSKCGLAVCEAGQILARAVVSPAAVADQVKAWQARYSITEAVIGNSTGAADTERVIASVLTVPVRRVDETGTTLRARKRYFQEHPPRGWRRFVPKGLLTPMEPYDDYAAVILAEAALAGKGPPDGGGAGKESAPPRRRA